MIFIKPKKGKKRNLHQVFSYIIWNTNMQNPHHWKKETKQNKQKLKWFLHQGLVCHLWRSWNGTADMTFVIFSTPGPETNWNLKLCLLGGGVGQQLNTPRSAIRAGWGAEGNGEGGASSNHMAYLMQGTCNCQRLKMVKSNRIWERERSVMYNIIYTLQLGLHLELRTSPKEVTF